MRAIGEFLLTILLILLVILISLAVAVGWIVGFGWLLSRWLPLSLGEGAIIVGIASGLALLIWFRILDWSRTVPPGLTVSRLPQDEFIPDDDEIWYNDDYPIPAERFAATLDKRTAENWLRYDFANELAIAIEQTPSAKGLMSDSQVQELAVRLSDMIVQMAKEKPASASRLTLPALKKRMTQLGFSPYDDAILKEALRTWQTELSYEEVRDIVNKKLWLHLW